MLPLWLYYRLFLGLFLAPKASEGFNDFNYKYLKKGKRAVEKTNVNVFRQINDNDIIYVSSFDVKNKIGRNFTLEHFENNKLTYKITANNIKYVEEDTTYRLTNYVKRIVGADIDELEIVQKKDTLFHLMLMI